MSIWGGVLFTDKVKGFTLIELLAVIVILAVIALIATPIVLNIIEQARFGAAKSSAIGYVEASEKGVILYLMENRDNKVTGECTVNKNVLTCGTTPLTLDIKGSLPSSGSITFDSKGNVKSVKDLIINGYKFNYNGTWSGEKSDGEQPPVKEAKPGDYVNYTPDNEKWNATRDGVEETEVKTQGTFNIYDVVTSNSANGLSKNESITCYRASYTTKYSGWRIMDVDSNGQITLIHGGTPECYYHAYNQSVASKEILKVRATSASNEGTGKAWTKYGNSTYALSVHYMDSDDVNIINYDENGNENYSLWDYLEKNERGNCYGDTNSYCGRNTELIDIGSYYYSASAYSTSALYFWNASSRNWRSDSSTSYGVRPVVVLKDSVKLGTGTGVIGDEYELELS